MHRAKVTIFEKNIQEYSGELLVFFAQSADEQINYDPRLKDLLGPQVECRDFRAGDNEYVLLYPEGGGASTFQAKRIAVVGLGKKKEVERQGLREKWRLAGGTLSTLCGKCKAGEIVIVMEGVEEQLEPAEAIECLTEGILLGDYRFLKYKKDDEENPAFSGIRKLGFALGRKGAVEKKAARRAVNLAYAVHSARDMANEPGNGWTAAHFADYAKKLAGNQGLGCHILDKARMKKLGMGGMLAVNQGSAQPPKLVILEYVPEKYRETVMLVGKGLTFDSGGISLKPAAGMQDMKYDMCGGAAVLAAMEAIASEKPKIRVICLIPATDNMSGSSALKPGDVIRHYSGITSEIVNTDAEGRLILADAIAYGIEQYQPDCVVDVATLTGAMVVALGHHHTGIFGNDDALVEGLVEAGKASGEPLWRMPLGKEYSKMIESKVADIKNAGAREGGAITAACYLEKFVGETAWAHLDIAGTAWDFTEKSYIPKGPAGIMVRTLVEFVRNREKAG